MKRIFSTVIAIMITLTIVGCEQFTVSYDRIESDDFRLLDFQYARWDNGSVVNSAEIAPGDTMALTAVFAGKQRSAEELDEYLDWKISFNIRRTLTGNTTVLDTMSFFEVGAVRIDPPLFRTDGTMSMSFKIPIPKDIMLTSESIPDKLIDMVPPDMRGDLPGEFALMTKGQMVRALEMLIDNMDNNDDDDMPETLPEEIVSMLSYLSVPIRIIVDVSTELFADTKPRRTMPHTIRSDHVIRYNRHFADYASSGVSVNTNPVIKRIVAFKVAGAHSLFDDKVGKEYCTLYVRNQNNEKIYQYNGSDDGELTIPVGGGRHSYFLEVITAGSRDSTLRPLADGTTRWVKEEHNVFWQFRLRDNETHGVDLADYMDVSNGTGELWPPSDRRIVNFTLWATVSDMLTGDRMRPDGGAFAEVKGSFDYGNDMSGCNMGVWVR